jgi:hypothetical protein
VKRSTLITALFVFVLLMFGSATPALAHTTGHHHHHKKAVKHHHHKKVAKKKVKKGSLHPPKGYPIYNKYQARAMIEAALVEDGISADDRADAHWVWSKESIRNLAHPGGKSHGDGSNGCMYGNWQLNAGKASQCAWYDPHASTHAAVRYVLNRYGSFHNARLHKLRTKSHANPAGWY